MAIDLEDAVNITRKAYAREVVATQLAGRRPSQTLVAVRVNAATSRLLEDDLSALSQVWSHLDVVVLPKADSADEILEAVEMIAAVDQEQDCVNCGPALIPLIETAKGILDARSIASASDRILTIAFGPADLSAELGVRLTSAGAELRHARAMLVLAAAAAQLPPPLDGPWLTLEAPAALAESTREARTLGFGGKQAIHPSQLSVIHKIFAPSADEAEWAAHVIAAFDTADRTGSASTRLPDGTFVDYAVAARARAILDEYGSSRR